MAAKIDPRTRLLVVEKVVLPYLIATKRSAEERTHNLSKRYNVLEQQLSQITAELFRLREMAERVEEEANTDTLTGLANRRRLAEAFHTAVENANADNKPLSLLMIDVDHFKRVNDQDGHIAGDTLLRYLASVLAERFRKPAVAARYGGEEFALLLPRTSSDLARKLAEAVQKSIARSRLQQRVSAMLPAQVTVSVGVAQYYLGESMEDLVRRSDEALYMAKHDRQNCVQLWACFKVDIETSTSSAL
ncbi:GGDEF-domain-containing protein [Zopfia rhizophila CBS 207.26]|uniref:GGDEF-domain-containing protein n=1 Tax=Zopfia rhizophila CBS 207.26 TaxID=1314779 RepID=A0A6A6E8P2_9PEZI|nr:GGDEF-domain-containing protein [Zopfia rhizophila CBS 207.26]